MLIFSNVLFMEVALEVLDDAGIEVSRTNSKASGLFVGAPRNNYSTVADAILAIHSRKKIVP